ncbi:restriction endonuclease subunit S [Lactobacillus johnsonii]|jgi:type I restriction enzyme S subunit|uniref:Restriction endonuclease subunit S n=1 Tax=Lactobacillus johnsonii TaxID=33959 RepID=A0AAW5LU78_LACJH|nr:restriction endonuclease subunit S [Lactobacillus johnsonii]MCR1915502.1 restriction endonuclease subunit S [Lactobacillus johnsonii]PJN78483.1 restriction endonuclease subunit S [Lactobacillus johnsonii]TWU81041.1 Type I restriction modification DNA specificity domain protein [Lactobacillus johnsonii]
MNKIKWTKKRLTDLGKFARGKSKHRPRNDKTLFKNGHYPLVQTGDIKKANLYIQKSEEFYNEKGLKQSKLWPTDTLCITIAANIAETALLGQPMCFPDSIVGFNAFPNKSNNLFVHYVFELLKQQIQDNVNGSIQKNINLEFLENFELMVPPLNYQNKVSKLLKDIDSKITNNNAISKELESMAKTIYDYWFLQFEFPDKDGKPYKSNGGKMVWNDQLKQEIPEGWEVSIVKNILGDYPRTKTIESKEYNSGSLYPIIDQSKDSYICGYTDNKDYVLNLDDAIVFGDHSNKSKYVNFPFARGADGTQILNSNNPRLPNYLLYQEIIALPEIEKGYSRHFKFLKAQNITIPTLDITKKYMSIVSNMLLQQRKIIKENQQLQSLRDFLLPMLMNGQVIIED